MEDMALELEVPMSKHMFNIRSVISPFLYTTLTFKIRIRIFSGNSTVIVIGQNQGQYLDQNAFFFQPPAWLFSNTFLAKRMRVFTTVFTKALII